MLSPVLFTMYIDTLLIELKNLGYGCYIGTKYMGSFSYADDFVIITPSQKYCYYYPKSKSHAVTVRDM